jgi:hypothetical protein
MTLDETAFDRSEFLLRLARRYQPGHWIGGLRKAFAPVAEVVDTPHGEQIETFPSHYLISLWRPIEAAAFLPRWPYKVSIVAPDAAAAVRALLVDVPRTARLWVAGSQIDWALMADIVMLSEPGLAPYHYRELKAFINAERQATLAAISVNYSGDDEMFEKFVRTTPDHLE